MCGKDYFWNSAACSGKNGKSAGGIIGDSVVKCDEIIDVTKSTLTKTIPTKPVPTKCSWTNFYILLSLLSIMTAVTIYVKKNINQNKNIYYHITILHIYYKMESNNKLREIDIKNCTCFYFDEIIKIEDLDFNNILRNKKSRKNILGYDVSKSLRIMFYKNKWIY